MNGLALKIDCGKFSATTFVTPHVTGISVLTDELAESLAWWFEKLKLPLPAGGCGFHSRVREWSSSAARRSLPDFVLGRQRVRSCSLLPLAAGRVLPRGCCSTCSCMETKKSFLPPLLCLSVCAEVWLRKALPSKTVLRLVPSPVWIGLYAQLIKVSLNCVSDTEPKIRWWMLTNTVD